MAYKIIHLKIQWRSLHHGTQRACFLFLLGNNKKKEFKGKQLLLNVNSLSSHCHCVITARIV